MATTYSIVKYLVLFSHGGHKGVFCEVIVSIRILLVCSLHLFVEGRDMLREKARKLEFFALFNGKACSLVEVWCIQQRRALILILILFCHNLIQNQ